MQWEVQSGTNYVTLLPLLQVLWRQRVYRHGRDTVPGQDRLAHYTSAHVTVHRKIP